MSVTGPVSRLSDRRFRVGDAAIFLEKQAGITTAGLAEGCPATVIGLSAAYDSPQIWPRSQADVIPGDCTPAACEPLTISQIQGSGDASPFDGKTGLACLTGCVTGVTADGFTLQSPEPDADPRTSEGIYAFRYTSWTNPRGLRPGDLVELRDFDVQEFYDQTEIVGLETDTEAIYRVTGRCELPAAVPVPPLTDPDADPASIYEPFEGMRVALSFDGAVTGPTARYVSRYPAGDPEIALVDRDSPLYGQRIFTQEGTTEAVSSLPVGRGMVYLTGGTGVDLPDVGTGDRVSATNLTGVLAYQFGRYVLMVEDPAPIRVEDAPDVVDAEAAIEPEQFAVCTMNLENLFDAVDDGDGDLGDWAPADQAGFEAQLNKRAAAIREDLRGCTIIGVQEVEGKDAVWEALARAVGPDFRYDYFESADVRDITVGVLYDARRVTLRRSEQAQTCTPTDYSVDYTSRPRPARPAQPLRRRRLSAVRPAALRGRPDGTGCSRRPGAGSADSRQPPQVQTRRGGDQRAAAGRAGALRGRAVDRAERSRPGRLQRPVGHADPGAVRRLRQPLRGASAAERSLHVHLQRAVRAAGPLHHDTRTRPLLPGWRAGAYQRRLPGEARAGREWTQLGSRPVVRAVQLSAHGGQRGVGWGSIGSSGGIRKVTGASLTVCRSRI